ncbi:sensor histidine kinase [Paenibacillus athensensis]|uniref:histidine kinase n=1 Tax=Paenibacillus athensensis TaxID=1967502 RepID=A0A4Y8Q8Z2_9BACL|nr:histidine kinase [Paenibacillus athensensis]MCD1260064.1 sensor histidine kinase [Paenibacillus athensensis]
MKIQPSRLFIPLGFKLFASHLLLVLIPIALLGLFSYHYSLDALQARTVKNVEYAMQQMENNIDYRIRDVLRGMESVYADKTVADFLSGAFSDVDQLGITRQSIIPKLVNASLLSQSPVLMTLYLDRPTFPEVYFTHIGDPLQLGRGYGLKYASRVSGQPWYKEITDNQQPLIWQQVDMDREYGNISLFHTMIDYESMHPTGLLQLTVKLKDVFQSVDYTKLGKESSILIFDERQRLLYRSAAAETAEENGPVFDDGKYLVIRSEVPLMNASLVTLLPKASLNEGAGKLRKLTLWISLLSSLVIALVSLLISNYYSKRILKLTTSLRSFQNGDFHKRITYRGNDEFTLISQAFNDMAQTIEQLFQEVYVNRLQKKEAELQTLQAQINPHFLYNTLSSIGRMAQLGRTEDLTRMIRGLAKFYRLTLNKGSFVISVADELEQVQAYAGIQKIKYGDRFQLQLEVDESLLDCETIKLVLQPFVENSLEHAWSAEHLEIGLSVYREQETIVFEISDNGLGMSEEKVRELSAQSGEAKEGYGIFNVDERVRLHYGEEYGVTIHSRLNEGTVVRIVIPVRPYRK